MTSIAEPCQEPADTGAHPVLGIPAGPPDFNGTQVWRLPPDAGPWPEVDVFTGRSQARAAAGLGELALAAGAEFFVIRCADVEVSRLRREDVPVPAWPVELFIVVTPVGPAAGRFEMFAGDPADGVRLAVAGLLARPVQAVRPGQHHD
ncbi:hypothetical protein [Crossiella sp. CA198]|uniref:hypothetical protein n=1 Tax=Crossiella sp. CA198 TaxID=3455607 RepID=UPI003F8D2900